MSENNFGQRLKYALDKLGYSLAYTTKELNLSKNALGNYINKNRIPETNILYKLSVFLGVPMEWLLTGNELINPPGTLGEIEADYIIRDDLEEYILKNITVNQEEEAIIRMYRQLNSKDQEEIQLLMKIKNGLVSGLKKKEKSSTLMHDEEAATSHLKIG